jgi:hypothetical protein
VCGEVPRPKVGTDRMVVAVSRPLVSRTRFAFRGGSVRCSRRSPQTINTNGAAGGCKESYVWCREPSGARRGWIYNDGSASPCRPSALRFQLSRPRPDDEQELAATATIEYYFFCWSNLVRSWIRNPPHQRRRATNDVGKGSVVVERD